MSRDARRRRPPPPPRRFLGKLTKLSLAKPKVVGLIATTRFGGLGVYCVIEWLKKFQTPLTPLHDPLLTPYSPKNRNFVFGSTIGIWGIIRKLTSRRVEKKKKSPLRQ